MSTRCILVLFTVTIANAQYVPTYFCGSTIDQKQFLIQSDYYLQQYQPNLQCEFVLKAECGNRFHFQFLFFEVEDSPGCQKDRLEVGRQVALCGFKSGIKVFDASENGELRLKFLTDQTISGRGFRILITKLPCDTHCCANSYKSRRFLITSPNYPHRASKSDCIFKIYKSNPNICRLRMHFKYFLNGVYNFGMCYNGFVKVDGKILCGCQTGLNLVSTFDHNSGTNPKVIRFKNDISAVDNFLRGFVLEVIQDECPDKYTPEELQSPQLFYYNDQLSNSHSNSKKYAEMFTVTIEKNSNTSLDIYRPQGVGYKEKEPTNYLSTKDYLFPNSNHENDYRCQNFNVNDLRGMMESVLWKIMPSCVAQVVKKDVNCCVVDIARGFVMSPGYPFYYGRNLNICYRYE